MSAQRLPVFKRLAAAITLKRENPGFTGFDGFVVHRSSFQLTLIAQKLLRQ
jgi:hypothetical protein